VSGLIYIAYPIDQAKGGRVAGAKKQRELLAVERWKELIRSAILQVAGMALYEPGKGFAVPEGAGTLREVEEVNGAALGAANGVVAILPADVATVGTIVEITRSVDAGKPVVLVTDLLDRSMTVRDLASMPNVRVVEYDPHGEGGWARGWAQAADEAAEWLVDQIEDQELGGPGGRVSELRFKRLTVTAQLPSRGYDDDAGMDLYVDEEVQIAPGEFADIATGVAVDLPDGYWARITGRSSAWRKLGLQVLEGIIDTGYTGPLFAGVYNPGPAPVVLAVGDRVAQLILHRTEALTPAWGDVRIKARGANGFGSTG
jgi:deoxyuridine 5'-triphosphate nucleotidohydrolase